MKPSKNEIPEVKPLPAIMHANAETLGLLAKQKPLRIKFGVDPTRPDLTLGHFVCFNFLRQLQEMGHHVILIIGDFTTTIGDPSGRSETRPMLSEEEIKLNSSTYLTQAFKVLDERMTTTYHNSEWFDRMDSRELIKVASLVTVNQLSVRKDFANRLEQNTPVSLSEFIYPLLQGLDSVHLNADIEIGGTDQLFNMQMGRELQEKFNKKQQSIITIPLLVGTDGVKKMSKSSNNFIAFNDEPNDIFGKVMSISDSTMGLWYKTIHNIDITTIESNVGTPANPMNLKKGLAHGIIKALYSRPDADKAKEMFEARFSRREVPDDVEKLKWTDLVPEGFIEDKIVNILVKTGKWPSKNQVIKLIENGAVKVNHQPFTKQDKMVLMPRDDGHVIKVGKLVLFKIV